LKRFGPAFVLPAAARRMLGFRRLMGWSALCLALSACAAPKTAPPPADVTTAERGIPAGVKPLTLEQEEQISR